MNITQTTTTTTIKIISQFFNVFLYPLKVESIKFKSKLLNCKRMCGNLRQNKEKTFRHKQLKQTGMKKSCNKSEVTEL